MLELDCYFKFHLHEASEVWSNGLIMLERTVAGRRKCNRHALWVFRQDFIPSQFGESLLIGGFRFSDFKFARKTFSAYDSFENGHINREIRPFTPQKNQNTLQLRMSVNPAPRLIVQPIIGKGCGIPTRREKSSLVERFPLPAISMKWACEYNSVSS